MPFQVGGNLNCHGFGQCGRLGIFFQLLTNHFVLVVRMFVQDHYSMDIFQFGDAIKDWQDRK
jgi:hypothetical protein